MNKNIDFVLAMNNHLIWKMRLRAFLDGEATMTIEEAISHKHCELGKWLYAEGLDRYSKFEDMSELEKVHEELHNTIKNIVIMKENGDIVEAENEFEKVNSISNNIVKIIEKLILIE